MEKEKQKKSKRKKRRGGEKGCDTQRVMCVSNSHPFLAYNPVQSNASASALNDEIKEVIDKIITMSCTALPVR